MVDDEAVDEDPEQFQCDECPVFEALAGLDSFNRHVWALYKQIVTRFAADLHMGSAMLDRLTRDLNDDDYAETLRRLIVLYNALNPPSKKET